MQRLNHALIAFRQLGAVVKIKDGLGTLKHIEPDGKIAGLNDALLGLEPKSETNDYSYAYDCIKNADLFGLLGKFEG